MGSKVLILRRLSADGLNDESLDHRSHVKASAKNHLLERIADALQVAPAVLYNPPNAVAPTRAAGDEMPDGGPDGGMEQTCEALLAAYRRIRDPEVRRRLLTLVEQASQRG